MVDITAYCLIGVGLAAGMVPAMSAVLKSVFSMLRQLLDLCSCTYTASLHSQCTALSELFL